MSLLQNLMELIPLLIWFILCGIGGFWLVCALFHLKPHEELMVGVAVGLSASTFLVNILGRFFPLPNACWLSAGLIFISGMLLMGAEHKHDLKQLIIFPYQPVMWIAFLGVTLLFWGMASGLSIMDEFQTLPLISQLAAGDLPLHFPLDPKVIYNYHYFPYLFSAQLMRLGNLFPWTALDIQQALFASLSLFLLGLWVYRVTNSQGASIGAALFYFFSGGTRWLLLFFPKGVLQAFDYHINRIGSGLNSGTSLQKALAAPWAAQGTGPFTIPFAFANGFNVANSIGLGYTNLPLFFLVILLLTFNHWKDWKGILIYIILLSSLALSHEITFVLLIIGTIVISGIWIIQQKSLNLPREIAFLLIALFVSGIISLFQGGVISGIFLPWFGQIQNPASASSSFHGVSMSLSMPPAFVDAHLGILSLFEPIQFLIWLLESGPMLLLIWPAIPWGLKAFQNKKWLEAILTVIIVFSLLLIFIKMDFKSSSLGAFTRAQNFFLFVLKIIAVPILYTWLPTRIETVKLTSYFLIAITIFGGVVIFGLQLPAIQKPVLSTFIEPLDAKIMKEYWNKLDPDFMVFDPVRMRSPVIFGRASNVGVDWFTNKPEWVEIYNNPNPIKMVNSGFGYLYSDQHYIHSLPQVVQDSLNNPCIVKLADVKDDFGGQRILLDLRACK